MRTNRKPGRDGSQRSRSPVAAAKQSCRSRTGRVPRPELPPPADEGYVPAVNIAPAVGWADGGKPSLRPKDSRSSAFAERARPPALALCPAERRRARRGDRRRRSGRAEELRGIKRLGERQGHDEGRLRGAERQPHHASARYRRRRRAPTGVPCSCPSLNSPFGMDARRRPALRRKYRRPGPFPVPGRETRRSGRPRRKWRTFPAGRCNHHWTKNVIASRGRLEALRHRRLEQQRRREWDGQGSRPRGDPRDRCARPARAASMLPGLRNPNGLVWEPATGMLWTVVNERDELGSDLVPDYMTSVRARRILRLALQLLRTGRRRSRRAAAAGPRRDRDQARLRARAAHGVARARALGRCAPARSLPHRHVHRAARLLESQAAVGL